MRSSSAFLCLSKEVMSAIEGLGWWSNVFFTSARLWRSDMSLEMFSLWIGVGRPEGELGEGGIGWLLRVDAR